MINVKTMKSIILSLVLLVSTSSFAQTVKILFDATKAEMAGNADWLIDADVNDLGVNANGKMISGIGDESNPQGIPTPAQSNITASTTETFWTGALSAWAVDCAKQNYIVETLPYNDSITYGNNSHLKDLKHYNIFVVCEPNILFTTAEKNAIVKFVQDGGRLFIISDHDVSDRNGDGYDSPTIWNDLFTTNTIHANPFGITFDLQNYSQTTSNVASLPSDSCLHGSFGNVTKLQISGGTTMTLNTANNNTVTGLIYKTGATTTSNTNVFFARAYYGLGKVCALGDSSPPDDGTGDANDVLYNGYTGDASGQHQWLLMNAMAWLAHGAMPLQVNTVSSFQHEIRVSPNPSSIAWLVEINAQKESTSIELFEVHGKLLHTKIIAANTPIQYAVSNRQLKSGNYFLKITSGQKSSTMKVVKW